ncbi:MAG: hypothetical protein KGJ60_13860 [Verrucomicrobiota bacterium]|nr:hypothetical protein [Verrucomicrobiota bacterium]
MKVDEIIEFILMPVVVGLIPVLGRIMRTMTDLRERLVRIETKMDFLMPDLKPKKHNESSTD